MELSPTQHWCFNYAPIYWALQTLLSLSLSLSKPPKFLGQNKHFQSSATMPPLAAVVLFLCAAAASVSATDHIVGANRGWNPGINYTLWANNHTFFVGDLISFRYQKNQYNVFEVNQTSYGNCTTEGALGNWSSGKDFIPLNIAQRYYFIGGNGQCFNGMKVTILVHPLPPPPSSPISTNHSSPSSATPREGSRQWKVRALLISLALIWFGSDWI